MRERILGFDLARAYAIFGMFIVNFNFCFGSFQDTSATGKFLDIFVGNSTAIFIILAGMGLALMTTGHDSSKAEKSKVKSVILKRSWFLVALGLLLFNWWPGDILHFYGAYMHIALFLLFIPKKYYLWTAFFAVVIFHLLLFVIPIELGWNFKTFEYADFWTPIGFLRNTLYNGWNAVFPWLAYFMIGMFLGRLNWHNKATRRITFFVGLTAFVLFEGLRYVALQNLFDDYWTNYIMSEYFPPYLPFMMITVGFALMVINICMAIADKFPTSKLILSLVKTGRMTLTWYVFHITLGMIIFSQMFHRVYTGNLTQEIPVSPVFILTYAILFYAVCVLLSNLWAKKYGHGPLEALMRKVSG